MSSKLLGSLEKTLDIAEAEKVFKTSKQDGVISLEELKAEIELQNEMREWDVTLQDG